MARQSLEDKEVVSANMGRKRKQKRDELSQGTKTNETIRWKQVWDLGNEVAHFFCILVLTALLRWLKNWDARDKEKWTCGNERELEKR